MVEFKGFFDKSLGGFPCIRGFAKFKDIAENSEPNKSYQRDLIKEHKENIQKFMDEGKFLFFPEVILSYTLSSDDKDTDSLINGGRLNLDDVIVKVNKNGSASFIIKRDDLKLSRVDGNHRLSAYEMNKSVYGDYNFPFCIVLFNKDNDSLKKEQILFHNINFKNVPLTMEKNLELLFKNIYSDSELEYLGLEFLLSKKIYNEIINKPEWYSNLPMLKYSKGKNKSRTYIYDAVNTLITRSNIESEFKKSPDKVMSKLSRTLQQISNIYKDSFRAEGSVALFSTLLFYKYTRSRMPVEKWLTESGICNIKESDGKLDSSTLITLYEEAHVQKVKDWKKYVRVTICSFVMFCIYRMRDFLFNKMLSNFFK